MSSQNLKIWGGKLGIVTKFISVPNLQFHQCMYVPIFLDNYKSIF